MTRLYPEFSLEQFSHTFFFQFNIDPHHSVAVAQYVEALRYKPADREFDSRRCH
jgi:hypothetical protein